MKTLRIGFWLALLAVVLCASARGQIVFGHPIDTGKTEEKSDGIFSSNKVVFEMTASSWSNVFIHFTTFTNYPTGWSNVYYMYATVVPAGGTWQIFATTNYDNFWSGDLSLWGHYNEGSNSTASFMFTIKALCFSDHLETWWYPTNVIGQTEVAPTNWVKGFGGPGVDGGSAVATDTNGNVYLAGYFGGTATIGSTNLTATGSRNMLLAKYNANGVLQWAKRFGLGTETPVGLVLDSSNNLCLVGSSSGPTDLSGVTTNSGPNYLTNGNVWVAKYNSSGTYLWGNAYPASSGKAIAVDSSDNLYVLGSVGGGGGVTLGGPVFYPFSIDTFVLKLNGGGAWVWDKEAGCTGDSVPGSIAIDSANNIFVAGGFKGTINWGSGLTNAQYAMGYAAYLTRLNSSGTCAWTGVYGNGYYGVSVTGVAVDSAGGVYMTGQFYSSLVIQGVTLNAYNNFGFNPFLAKFSNADVAQWSTAPQGPNPSWCPPTTTAIAVDDDDNVWIAGVFASTMTMGTNTVTSLGGQDIYIGEYSSVGTNVFATAYGGPLYTYANMWGLDIDSGGSIIGTGAFYQTATFGSTVLNSQGGYDGFLLRQHP